LSGMGRVRAMKITIEQYGNSVSAEIPDESTMERVIIALKGLAVAAGFHPETVDRELIPGDWGLYTDE
jgi:hypothetical protein